MKVEVGGAAVPRLSRREIAAFARRVLRACGTGSQPVRRPKGGRWRVRGRVENPSHIAELSIAFVDDATMRALNRKFRRKNKTTDVLTFPDEIVISLDQARRQDDRTRSRATRFGFGNEHSWRFSAKRIHFAIVNHATIHLLRCCDR